MRENKKPENAFIGRVSNPSLLPIVAGGLVVFTVHPLRGGILRHKQAQLISLSGEVYPVTVRSTGYVHPGSTPQSSWIPGDLLASIDGITLEQARNMRTIVQEYVEDGTPFAGEVIEINASSKSNFIELRVRPQPYAAIALKEAQLITQAGETISVVLRRIEAAPASPTLGCFGDLIVSLEGIPFEQAKFAQKLTQE